MVTVKMTGNSPAGEAAEKLEPSDTAGGIRRGAAAVQEGGSPSKRSTDSPHDPAIPLLGVYPAELETRVRAKRVHPYL